MKRADFQLSWAMTFPGSLPEPRRQDHKFRGHLLPKEVVSCLPRLCLKEIPRKPVNIWQRCSFCFRS